MRKGAYVLADLGQGKPQVILMASGSEVGLIVQAGKQLAAQGICVRLVSFPSWELFAEQDAAYRDSVLLPEVDPAPGGRSRHLAGLAPLDRRPRPPPGPGSLRRLRPAAGLQHLASPSKPRSCLDMSSNISRVND